MSWERLEPIVLRVLPEYGVSLHDVRTRKIDSAKRSRARIALLARRELGMSQVEVAAALGVHRHTIMLAAKRYPLG